MNAALAWIVAHPGKTYHVGNEPYCGLPSCNNDLIYQSYARWYYYSWQLVKSIDPTAAVCSAIPIGWNKPGEESSLYKLWNTYRLITGNPMPTDCWPIHRYAVHGEGGWTLEGETAFYNDPLALPGAAPGDRLDRALLPDPVGIRIFELAL